MKKFLLPLLYIICALTSCEKAGDTDELVGKWRLLEIHSKLSAEDATYSLTTDKRDSQMYWSFQLGLLQISSIDVHNGKNGETFARYVRSGEQLTVKDTYVHFRDRDSLITDPQSTALVPAGIRGNAASFRIVRLSGSQLLLTSSLDSLVFYRTH